MSTLKGALKPLLALGIATTAAIFIYIPLRAGASPLSALVVAVLGALAIGLTSAVTLMPKLTQAWASRLPGNSGKPISAFAEWVTTSQDAARIALFRLFWNLSAPKRVASAANSNYAVLLPSDVVTVGGSLGDQALIGGVVYGLRQAGITELVVVCHPHAQMPVIEGLKVRTLPSWGKLGRTGELAKTIAGARTFVIIGADILDGYYAPFEAELRYVHAEMAAQVANDVRIVSYSYNDKPNPRAIRALKRLPASVRHYPREVVSAERVAQAGAINPKVVADVGFLLEPAIGCALEKQVADWTNAARAQGKTVLAWNVSPHSVKNLGPTGEDQITHSSVTVIKRLLARGDTAILLVPHDFRSHASDYKLLRKVKDALGPVDAASCTLLEGPYRASEIKAAAGHFDVLFTGRMHLMIGTLSRQVPVAVLDYQAKSEGLMKHFGLGPQYTTVAQEARDPEKLWAFVERALNDRELLKKQVIERLPEVKKLSMKNFEGL